MKKPDIPDNEKERLESLDATGVLDTPAEERFDRIARLAKHMFNVPIALVSIVDVNRQWFKSCFGLPVRETSRDISFCGHAILGDDLFIINDTFEDDRFIDNPLVTEAPFIRFYAGCPIQISPGLKLGTLCIIDQKPRTFSEQDKLLLKDLAKMVESELSAVQLATMDALTGISNRRGFELLAKHSLSMCKREKINTTLIFIDLNGFKKINDNLGHNTGDQILQVFSALLNEAFRNTDLIARLGGDEFVALLSGCNTEQSEKVMQIFQAKIDQYNSDNAFACPLTYSYGLINFDPQKHPTLEALLEDADTLMYAHKKRQAS